MKGIILGLTATVFIGFNSKAQTSKEIWLLMIENHKVNVAEPLGVGIAVGTFGYCIYQASLD